MSRNGPQHGIVPFAPERDDELGAEVQQDEMLQTEDEPIRRDGEQEQLDSYANVTEDLY